MKHLKHSREDLGVVTNVYNIRTQTAEAAESSVQGQPMGQYEM